MSNHTANKPEIDDPFDALFREAEQADGFWVSKAKLHFTEEMLSQMKALDVSKSTLAERLGVKPTQISRLCSGLNNFTIETMVRVARSLDCEFRSHLQPAGTNTMWIDVLKDEPVRPAEWGTNAGGDFKLIASEQNKKEDSHVIGAAA